MKNPKLLIPIRCTTRKIYLQSPPQGRNDWHVRFTAPSVDGSRREIFRSTGTKEIPAAKRIAAQIIESFWTDAGRGSEPLKLRNDNATVGALIERYRANARQRRDTIQGNVQSLRLMIRTLHRGDPDRHPSTILNARLVREFERKRIVEAEKLATPQTRATTLQRVRTSTASYLRQARSVVAPAKIKFYEGMKLPDLSGFRARG